MRHPKMFTTVAPALIAGAFIGAAGSQTARAELKGRIRIDGSSTVAPISTAAAEMFMEQHPRVRVTVGISGTGGGFKKFLDENPSLRTDISDASRVIKPSEVERAKRLGVEYIEVPIGLDGLSVVVRPDNNFCDHLSVDELKRIWEPGSPINNWKQVRPGFPDMPLKLYGPGTDSGTFDYFTEAIVGKSKASRSDYTASESDNVLVRGVAGDPRALGYFGYSYYMANKDKLKLVAVEYRGKRVEPTLDTIRSGRYQPLSRPMFLYVNAGSFQRPEVQAFLKFTLDNARAIVEHPRVNYVSFSDELYALAWKRLQEGRTGSAVNRAGETDMDLTEIFRKF